MRKRFFEELPGKQTMVSALTVASLWILSAPTAFADTNATSAFQQVVGQTVTQASIVTDIRNVAMGLFAIVAAAAAGFGIVYIALGGIALIHGGGMKKQEGMEKIRNGAIGIVVALGAATIVAIAAWVAGMFVGTTP
jgi:hypothetical protein